MAGHRSDRHADDAVSAVALIAWRILLPPEPSEGVLQSVAQADLEAQRAVLDKVIGKLTVAPEGIVNLMEENRQKNDELQATNLGLLSRVRDLNKTNELALEEQAALKRRIDRLENSVERLKENNTAKLDEIESLEERLAKYESKEEKEKEGEGIWDRIWPWKWVLVGVLFVFAAAVALILTLRGPRSQVEFHESALEDPSDAANNS